MAPAAPPEPIAVCGMAARLPGEVRTPAEFWDMLMAKRNGLVDWPRSSSTSDGGKSPATAGRFDAAGFQSSTPAKNTLQAPQAYLLDHVSMGDFDPSFFPVGAKEASRMDPMQRQLLEVAYECAENAGAARNLFGGNTSASSSTNTRTCTGTRKAAPDLAACKDVGVFVGVFGEDWLQENVMDSQLAGLYRGTGFLDFLQANRVSFAMDWQGPSIVVKTGCSASLVALDMACHSLRAGECAAAVVLGVNLITSPLMTLLYTAQGLLSPSGCCRTFDAAANGYGRGEAVNAVFLRRLSDAERAGDPIRALVRASATGHDGRKVGQLKPDAAAQELLIRKAYALAGIPDSQFGDTAWIECHGTGTAVGDPIEMRSVANVFGRDGIVVGSVKPNVGHSEGAAGLTGLIKAVLSLEHNVIPPNIFFNTPNPLIPWKAAQLRVPVDPVPWPDGRKKRVSVNSFGVGGSNAHVIVEACRPSKSLRPRVPTTEAARVLLLFSATHPWSLQKQVLNHRNYLLERLPASRDDVAGLLRDVAYTLGCRRHHFPLRTYTVVGVQQEPENENRDKTQAASGGLLTFVDAGHSGHVQDKTPPSRVAFVFTGQGAQSARMGYELLRDNNVFADSIHYLDQCLKTLPDNLTPDWTLFEELSKPAPESLMDETRYSLPCCAAVQIGLVNMFRAWGVLPAAVVGHSSGEVASAYAAGVLPARKAIIIAYLRGMVLEEVLDEDGKTLRRRPGAMATVGLGAEQTARFLSPGAVIACDNSPSSTTVSGDDDAVQETLRNVAEADSQIRCHALRVRTAFHSHHVEPSALKYEELLRPLLEGGETGKRLSSSCSLYSSVSGSLEQDAAKLVGSARYWRDSLAKPVLFRQALEQLLSCEHSPNNPRNTNPNTNNGLLLLEIGPHPALRKPVAETLSALQRSSSSSSTTSEPQTLHIATLRRGERSDEALLRSAGELFVRGALTEANMESIFRPDGSASPASHCLTDLPPYAWHHGTQYLDPPRVASVYKSARRLPHELLGARVPDATDIEPCWRCVLEPDDQPAWLGHHVIDGQTVFPAAGFVAMAGEAVSRLGHGRVTNTGYFMRNVSVKTALVVPQGSTFELFTRLSQAQDHGQDHHLDNDAAAEDNSLDGTWYDFHIMALVPDRDGDRWTSHCRGLVAASGAASAASSNGKACHGGTNIGPAPSPATDNGSGSGLGTGLGGGDGDARTVDSAEWYSIADSVGLSYGPSLQGLQDIAASTSRLAASATVYDYDDEDDEGEAGYALHPAVLDMGLQLNLVAMCQGLREKCDLLLLPTYIEELSVGAVTTRTPQDNGSTPKAQDGRLEMRAEVRWVRKGRSLQGTITATTSAPDDNDRGEGLGHNTCRRLSLRNVKFMAKPPLARHMPQDAPVTTQQPQLASVFDWAPDAELIDTKRVGSVVEMARLFAFKNPRVRVCVFAHDGDVVLASAVTRALETQAMSNGNVLSSLTYAAATTAELGLAQLSLQEDEPHDARLVPTWLDLSRDLPAQPEEGHSDFDLVLIDGPAALTGLCSISAPHQCALPVGPGGWLLVDRSSGEAETETETDRKLEQLGFTLVGRYSPASGSINKGMHAARALLPSHEKDTDSRQRRVVIILATPALDELARSLQSALDEIEIHSEIRVSHSGDEPLPVDNDDDEQAVVVSMLYLEQSPAEEALTAESFRSNVDRLLAARNPHVWLLPPLQLGSTGPASLCQRPDPAWLIGLTRTARTEYPALDLTTIELDTANTPVRVTAGAVARIIERLIHLGPGPGPGILQHDRPDMDRELGVTDDGTVLIPRMTWSSLDDAAAFAKADIMSGSDGLGLASFREDASYLLVGGLGGLGRSVCRWMAARGARHLVLFSRSASDPDAATIALVDELASMGCAVVRVGGCAEHFPAIKRAVAAAEHSAPRGLAGVLHMPMVLRDRPLRDMTWDDWTAVVDPKVRGAWNLHNTLNRRRRVQLDFFVLFSSVSGIVGQHGQANYNAANVFLDAFAMYRRGLGLPASVLDLGIVGHVGAVARDEALAALFRKSGYVFLGEETVLQAVGIAVSPSAPAQLVVGLAQDPQADNATRAVVWNRDPRMAKALGSGSGEGEQRAGASAIDAIKRETQEIISWAKEDPAGLVTNARRESLASCLGRAIYQVLVTPLKQLSLTRNINSLGLDSFAAVELTAWIQQHFGVQLSTMEANTSINLLQLADLVMDRMVAKHR
ncbi:KR domain-containing protein [Colletotrichum higginsianum IMI 349063]|uniref:KR domain-containing protein n=2 Tax=Colletotrichum higginsianum TaxID=80884 RepID=A0A1B7YBV7_COLHI|nr:KR domain-containing protein [Colletotrichum higginsianum IMI 349063]OBR09603.1 KR domain-containing protein [Colletotrichum higginsianum IMI 349063]TIC95435.1 Reducing polyketide synthase FUB1 [Colletotrichum higginsianum]